MPMWIRRFVLRKPDDEGGAAAGGGGAAGGAGAASGAAAGAAAAGASGAAAAGAATGAGAGAAGAAGSAAAGAAAGAGSGAAAGGAGAAAGAAAGAGEAKPVAAKWPEDWRETVSKDDAKVLSRLQRYGSPEAALQALIAAQNRISSGELKPVLGKDATPEQLAEWRTAHGIPETADKYDLGKDVKIAESDKPMFDVMMKALHKENATPQHVAAVVKTWYSLTQQAREAQADADKKVATESEDALRTEWGENFRRHTNLVHGLLDGAGSQGLKENLLGGRLADGTPIGSSPDALRMLLGLALVQNPTGVVVPGGGGENGETIKTELDKLKSVPANKKTEAQSSRERDLIGAALKAGFMNPDGSWKRV